jgi:hypothetical protein
MAYQSVPLILSASNPLFFRAGVDDTGGEVVVGCFCLVSAISANAT